MSTPFYITYVALWILVIFQSLILLGLVRMIAQLQQSNNSSGMMAGQEAPAFSVVDLAGRSISTKNFAGHLTALLFVSPTCPSCMTTLAELEAVNHKAQGNVIVICRAGRIDCAQFIEQYQLKIPVVADEDEQISRLYHISSVPTAVLINAQNRIQSYGQPLRENLEQVIAAVPDLLVQEVA